MKPEDQLDQLINTTKQIPLAMDIARIDALVATFPTQDPPSGLGYRAPRILTLALAVTVAVALLLYFSRGQGEPPQLAGVFPVVETEAEVPQTEVPADDVVEEPAEKKVVPAAPQAPLVEEGKTPVPAIITDPAPAAAPSAPPAPTAQSAAKRKRRKVLPPLQNPRSPLDYGPATISGEWTLKTYEHEHGLHGGRMLLQHTERVNGRTITWALPVELSAEEALLVGEVSAKGGYLERETGRLFVEWESRRSGTFSYQPHLPTRNRYEKAGWGTRNVPAAEVKLIGMQQGASLRPEWATNDPAELTWLRYFTNNVNDDYLATLAEIGVSNVSILELWRLPNQDVDASNLGALHTLLDELLAEDAAPLSMPTLVWAAKHNSVLRELIKQGYSAVSTPGLDALAEADPSDYFLTRANFYRQENFSPEDLAALFTTGLTTYAVNDFQRYLSPDLTVRDYEALQAAKIESYLARDFRERSLTELTVSELLLAHREKFTPEDIGRLNDRGIYRDRMTDYITARNNPSVTSNEGGRVVDRNFGRRKKGYRKSKVELEAFTSLRVEDDLRVVVVQGDKYKAEVLTAGFGGEGLRIDFDVDRKGELTIRKKLKLGWKIEGMILGEIRLTVPALRGLSVKAPARVYLTEEIGMFPGAFRAIVID